jgi:uncharacterized lipoprotein YmbA
MKMHWRFTITVTLAILFVGCSSFDPCENTFIRQAASPDGKLKAIVFSRGCGATTSETVQVSILDANASLPNEAGNILVVEEVNVYVKWLSASQLQVTVPTAKIFEKQQRHGSITISYK